MPHDTRIRKEFMIVGRGPHGLRISAQLLKHGVVRSDELVCVDPARSAVERLKEYLRDCGTQHLRSGPYEHVHPDDEHLNSFCEGRSDAFARGDRPCVNAWLEHAASVVEEFQLDAVHEQAWVSWFERVEGGIHVWTSAGEYLVKNLILALGQSRPYYPEWAARYRGHDPRICSIFDNDFEGDQLPRAQHPVVLGAGITAAQVVDVLFRQGAEKVTLLSRRALSKGEGKTSSLSWRDAALRAQLCGYKDPMQRDEMLRAEGDHGNMPSWEIERMQALIEEGRLEHIICDVAHVDPTSREHLSIIARDGRVIRETGLLTLCTGFVPEMQDWLRQAARKAALSFYPDGQPELTDYFEWGKGSGIFMTGHFARRVGGPFAHNVVGGITVADCLCKQFL